MIYAGSASRHTPPLADVSPQDFLNPSEEGMAADAVICISLFIVYNIFVYSVIACSAFPL